MAYSAAVSLLHSSPTPYFYVFIISCLCSVTYVPFRYGVSVSIVTILQCKYLKGQSIPTEKQNRESSKYTFLHNNKSVKHLIFQIRGIEKKVVKLISFKKISADALELTLALSHRPG